MRRIEYKGSLPVSKIGWCAVLGALVLALAGCSAADKVVDKGDELLLTHLANMNLETQAVVDDEDNGVSGPEAESEEEFFRTANPPEPAQCYYYSGLEDAEQGIYEEFLQGLSEHREQIMLDTTDEDMVYTLYEMILADHPELFWVDGGYSYLAGRRNMNVMPTYSYSAAEASARQDDIVQAGREVLQELRQQNPVSDYDKVKAVFEYVVHVLEYREDSEDNQNLYSALVNRESVCAGYTKMTQYLLQQLGVQALYISGDVTDLGSHAWNMVRCDGSYYLVDTTYGDCDFQEEGIREHLPDALICDYNYLCCSSEYLMQDREAHPWAELPACNSEDLSYYRMQGRFYEAVDDTLAEDMEECIRRGDTYWNCQFANQEAYDTFLEKIQDSYYLRKVLDVRGLTSVQGYSTFNEHFLSVSCWYES